MITRCLYILVLTLTLPLVSCAQWKEHDGLTPHLYSQAQLDMLFAKPECLKGYSPPAPASPNPAESFNIEPYYIPSGSCLIHGWLYLPRGKGRHPLIVLTNGGGKGAHIRSFPDWMAPILAHCGIAAFVHDKRGTGKSEGVFKHTCYDDYINDAGNCARQLSLHPRIDSGTIGIMGASEGGRIAVLAANRFPEFKFVISYAGTVVSAVEDRIYAQKGWLKSLNLPDSVFRVAMDIHERSIRAWASENPERHAIVDQEIQILRKHYDREILPYTKVEMDHSPEWEYVLPTWYSLPNDYLTELAHFRKKWLAIFGESDQRVPTRESIVNIHRYMGASGNEDYWIAVIPCCGHAPINLNTQRMIRLDHLILHWLDENILTG
jgi:pimeloyl-ACP methyl ester carboxylesterase